MALHIKADGTITQVTPKNGKKFTLEEIQDYVGCYFQPLIGKNMINQLVHMAVNKEGKIKGLPINAKASTYFNRAHSFKQHLVGNVLILDPGQKF